MASTKRFSPAQRGVALLTAILVVALATTAAAALLAREHLAMRRTMNTLYLDQAQAYTLGAESWASQILRRDNRNVDHLGEAWAVPLPATPVEGGSVGGRLQDAQARFNLNNLLDKDQQPSALDVEQFQRLLRALELPPELAQAVIDWIDPDGNPMPPGGAEDYHYLGLPYPYRSANQPLRSSGELRLVQGFDSATLSILLPYVTALPKRTGINVNTAPAPVLMSLVEGMRDSQAQQLLESRKQQRFNTPDEFLKRLAVEGLQPPSVAISVNSEYFLLQTQADLGEVHASLRSLLFRGISATVAIQRSLGEW